MSIRRILLLAVLFFTVSLGSVFAQSDESAEGSAMDPKAGEAYNKGNELMKAGNYTAAIKSYDAALAVEKDYRIYYQKGIALKKANQNKDAEEAFKASIKANPDFDLAYNGLGSVYFSTGDIDKAIENFEKFGEKTKKENLKKTAKEYISRAYAKKGADELNNGNQQKAISSLNKAVENADYDAAYLSLAKAYVETSDYNKAVDAASNALKHRKTISKGGPYYYLGVAYKNLGDAEKAKENLQQASSDNTYKKLAEYELETMR